MAAVGVHTALRLLGGLAQAGGIDSVGFGRFAVGATVLGALAECSWSRVGWPRPWSINRQVPQTWGHRAGPWKAAARYGFRLGVGPATMLNSWSWWAGSAVAVSAPDAAGGSSSQARWIATLVFPVWFALLRSVMVVALPGNPVDGAQLANRMARLQSVDARSRQLAAVGAIAAAFLTVCAHTFGGWQ